MSERTFFEGEGSPEIFKKRTNINCFSKSAKKIQMSRKGGGRVTHDAFLLITDPIPLNRCAATITTFTWTAQSTVLPEQTQQKLLFWCSDCSPILRSIHRFFATLIASTVVSYAERNFSHVSCTSNDVKIMNGHQMQT